MPHVHNGLSDVHPQEEEDVCEGGGEICEEVGDMCREWDVCVGSGMYVSGSEDVVQVMGSPLCPSVLFEVPIRGTDPA